MRVDFALYRKLLKHRPIRRLLIVAMVARIPHSAAGVLLTLHIVLTLGLGFAAAGAAAAIMTIGITVGAPWQGRRVDRLGLRRALIPSIVSEALIWSIVPHVEYQWILPLAFLGGLFNLPIFSVVRQALGILADVDQRRSAFALDSITVEVVFMIGPAAGAAAATMGWSGIALTVLGVTTSLAGIFLVWFNPPTRSLTGRRAQVVDAAEAGLALAPVHVRHHAEDHHGADVQSARSTDEPPTLGVGSQAASGQDTRGNSNGTAAWFTPTVAVIFIVAVGTGIVMSGSTVGIIALLERQGREADIGVVYFFWCAASVAGGILYGALHRPISPTLLLFAMAILTVPMGLAQATWTIALLTLLPGLLCAPVLSAASEKVADIVDERRRGEAMGWYGSVLTAGSAIGTPMAGVFVDVAGPWAGFVSAGAAGLLLCLLTLAFRRPKRREGTSKPRLADELPGGST